MYIPYHNSTRKQGPQMFCIHPNSKTGKLQKGMPISNLLISFTVYLATVTASQAADNVFSRLPYLQLATDSSIQVVWRTTSEMDPIIRYGKELKNLQNLVTSATILERQLDSNESISNAHSLHSAPKGTRQFEAKITGLEPNTTYYYSVFDGENRLTPSNPSYHFKTHPIPDKEHPLFFWVIGDSGTGGEEQFKVHRAMRKYNKAKSLELDLFIHVGDMAYSSGTDGEFSERFFKMYEPTLRNTVCWAAMGNHEGKTSKGEEGVGPYYDAYVCPKAGEAGGLPSGKEAYYSFDFGKTHFIVLDSHDLDRRPTGAMAQWLKADLEKTNADWLIAYFHHPPYTKGSHDSDKENQLIEMRQHIMPILESGGVDIVFTGHSHIYERSMLIDGAYATPTIAEGVILDDGDGDPNGDGPYIKSQGLVPHNGTVQVVSGHGGTKVSRGGTMPIMRAIFVENGSVLVSVSGNTLTGTMLNLDGIVRDTFAIKKQGTVNHSPVAEPWNPVTGTKPTQKKSISGGDKVPPVAKMIIGQGSNWAYLPGNEKPPEDWTKLEFNHSSWQKGESGFGFGDEDDRTLLEDMKDNYSTVYLRRSFALPDAADLKKLGLAVSYDDAFIAYINGKEILRVGIESGRDKNARNITTHEANKTFEFFPFDKYAIEALQGGVNVIAIEGHNHEKKSSDFTLHPTLILIK